MCEKITMVENGKILSTDAEVADSFDNFFTNMTILLDIEPYSKESPNQLTIEKMDLRAMENYQDHFSISLIKQHDVRKDTFQFSHVNPTEVMKQVDLLDSKKSSSGNIQLIF